MIHRNYKCDFCLVVERMVIRILRWACPECGEHKCCFVCMARLPLAAGKEIRDYRNQRFKKCPRPFLVGEALA